jgi:hypothetical protein
MKFFKDNSYDIVRLFINQVGITIFSLVLYTAVGFVEDSKLSLTLKVVLSIFSTAFYFSLLYTVAWDYGSKDQLKIESGKYQISKYKGIFLGLFSNALNFILTGLCSLSIGIYMLNNQDWLFTAFGILNLIMRFILAMYLGMIQGLTSGLAGNVDYLCESLAYVIFPLFAVFFVAFGYSMGLKNKRLFSSARGPMGQGK